MTVEKLISGYKTSKNKDEYIKKHVKNNYVVYEEKMARCRNIIDASMYVEIDDRKVFKQNSPLQYILFCMTLINCYTDIEISFEDNLMGQFNSLNENGFINELIINISESEYTEFNTILHMMIDDVEANERGFAGFLDSKVEAVTLLLNTMMSSLEDSGILEQLKQNK